MAYAQLVGQKFTLPSYGVIGQKKKGPRRRDVGTKLVNTFLAALMQLMILILAGRADLRCCTKRARTVPMRRVSPQKPPCVLTLVSIDDG